MVGGDPEIAVTAHCSKRLAGFLWSGGPWDCRHRSLLKMSSRILRQVGAVEARIKMRSLYSQVWPTVAQIWAKVLPIANIALSQLMLSRYSLLLSRACLCIIIGASVSSAFLWSNRISVAKSAELLKSATEKRNPKQHLSFLVAICNWKRMNRIPRLKVGLGLVV